MGCEDKMDEIFEKIEVDKRERIINSAFEEFSKNGYENASTNVIVKNAKISKGLLFHYFGNKLELYNKLSEFAMQTITESISKKIDWNITDFFERIKQVIIIKVELTKEYPYIYKFFKEIFKGKSIEEIRKLTDKESEELAKKAYSYHIDFSMFKEEFDLVTTMNIIRWTLEKMGEELWDKMILNEEMFTIKEMEQETDKYIRILRKTFYKEEMEELK